MVQGVHLPNIDVYTGELLKKKDFSKEHLIPKKFFRHGRDANNPWNIVPCHKYINNKRSDYKYGELFIKDPEQLYDIEPIYLKNNLIAGVINKKQRIFYPPLSSYKGMIARNSLILLNKYPYLYDYLSEIIEEPWIFEVWQTYPTCKYEEMLQNVLGDRFH